MASIAVLCAGAAGVSALAQTAKTAPQAPAVTSVSGQPTGGGGPQLDPCTLVTLSEAEGITGGSIANPVEAPLGPTCIYKPNGSKPWITISVETRGDFAGVTHLMRNGAPYTAGSHSAVCGQLGDEMVFLSLGGGRVLHVTAPCAIAKQFAIKALSRLGG